MIWVFIPTLLLGLLVFIGWVINKMVCEIKHKRELKALLESLEFSDRIRLKYLHTPDKEIE